MAEVTGVADEKDGSITVGEVKYVKESDLLAIKGSRDSLQDKLTAAEALGVKVTEADTKVAVANQERLKAEAKVESLTEEIKTHTGTTEQLKQLQAELVTAQEAGKSSATELLELRRTFIVSNYKVPPDTVKDKDLAGLAVFEEALKAVIGAHGGNYAFGGGGGGAGSLEGKTPHELAKMWYEQQKK